MNAKQVSVKQALGLLGVGVIMRAIPSIAPGWFPPTGCDGSNASAIWLGCMGTIEAAIGGWYLVKLQLIPGWLRRRRAARTPVRAAAAQTSVALGTR